MNIQPVLSPFTNVEHVSIAEREVPIIIPFGPAYSGKTMMLYRLFQFLLVREYAVKVNRIFVHGSLFSVYEELAEKFIDGLLKGEIPVATTQLPLLFDVVNRNGDTTLCHILDQTGTFHFDKNDIENPVYLAEIMHCPNKKIWMFMLEPCCENEYVQRAYIKRIIELKAYISPQDNVLFVATKADMFANIVDIKGIFHEMQSIYPGLFDVFKNTNPITRLLRPYNFDFVAFSAGKFVDIDGIGMYRVGDDKYPETLWKTVLKNI